MGSLARRWPWLLGLAVIAAVIFFNIPSERSAGFAPPGPPGPGWRANPHAGPPLPQAPIARRGNDTVAVIKAATGLVMAIGGVLAALGGLIRLVRGTETSTQVSSNPPLEEDSRPVRRVRLIRRDDDRYDDDDDYRGDGPYRSRPRRR